MFLTTMLLVIKPCAGSKMSVASFRYPNFVRPDVPKSTTSNGNSRQTRGTLVRSSSPLPVHLWCVRQRQIMTNAPQMDWYRKKTPTPQKVVAVRVRHVARRFATWLSAEDYNDHATRIVRSDNIDRRVLLSVRRLSHLYYEWCKMDKVLDQRFFLTAMLPARCDRVRSVRCCITER